MRRGVDQGHGAAVVEGHLHRRHHRSGGQADRGGIHGNAVAGDQRQTVGKDNLFTGGRTEIGNKIGGPGHMRENVSAAAAGHDVSVGTANDDVRSLAAGQMVKSGTADDDIVLVIGGGDGGVAGTGDIEIFTARQQLTG